MSLDVAPQIPGARELGQLEVLFEQENIPALIKT
jgi:hypothetical protein